MDAGTTIALIAYFIIGIVIPLAASVAFGVCSANIARKKGYSYGGFFALGFFTWLIGLIIALCLNDRKPAPDPSHEAVSTADSILKYKMLLDQGAITPAEFEAKKAELLGVAADASAVPGVPAGRLWVMGDNRTNSQDSRYFGAVPTSAVIGKALL